MLDFPIGRLRNGLELPSHAEPAVPDAEAPRAEPIGGDSIPSITASWAFRGSIGLARWPPPLGRIR